MYTETMIRQLQNEAEKHKNDKLLTFQTDITAMCNDIIPKLEQLKHYEDLAEQGRLVELPCKVGDTVWEVFYVKKENRGCIASTDFTLRWYADHMNKFGNTIFLTKEEAEQALAERQGENDE